LLWLVLASTTKSDYNNIDRSYSCFMDPILLWLVLASTTKSDYNNIDISCSCFMDPVSAKIVDPAKLKRIAHVYESTYALNELVVCVEFIEAR